MDRLGDTVPTDSPALDRADDADTDTRKEPPLVLVMVLGAGCWLLLIALVASLI